MADEHIILNHYNLTSAFPSSWPTEKDDSDTSGGEKDHEMSRHYIRRSRSRYSALERHGSDRRSLVPGSEKLPHGQENLVQKDEPDPLGGSDSVVKTLRRKGLPMEEDSRLRNRFLLSSTTFSPSLFLSQVHSQASTQELLHGLETLSRSIDSKSASLKVLVESNFERFVRAKTTIDNVYSEMRNHGAEPEPRSRGHSRVASRESRHFRNLSGQGPRSPNLGLSKSPANDKAKNALKKESEYGVQGIKAPLIEAAVKAEEIWGPALGGREREGHLKVIMESVDKSQEVFKLGKSLSDLIKRRDYDSLIEEYGRARRYADEARQVADRAYRNEEQLTDSQVHQIVITGRMWSDVEGQIEGFKRDTWRKLTNVQMNAQPSLSQASTDGHMPLISILLELGVDDNPIWVWLLSQYDYLKNKINATFERSRVEIEVLRRRLANADAPSPSVTAGHLRVATTKDVEINGPSLDTPPVVELWTLIYDSLSHLLSIRNGILGEIIDFWDKAQTIIDGKVQKTLPIGIDGRSRKHHRLSADGIKDLQSGVVELIGMLQEHIFSFFADPPIEDVSMLYSPSPISPSPATPISAHALSPYAHQDSRFRFDESNPPPSSPKRGEPWEEFAFWPPYANSLSAVHYLEKCLSLLGSAAGEMATLRPVLSGHSLPEKLRMTVSGARERSLRAACAAWGKDAEILKYLEDWTRVNEHQELTNMPSCFTAFQTVIMLGMQKILYISEAATKSGAATVITPPATKLVQMVRSSFVTSLYKALSGTVENAERSTSLVGTNGSAGGIAVAKAANSEAAGGNRNIRLLLTLSNLRLLQSETIPALISQFETHFSITLTNERAQIREALTQISDRLFLSYATPISTALSTIIHTGLATTAASTSRPSEVRPYVYDALLRLVYSHTEVSTTTPGGPLTNQVLSHLLEQLFEAFLSAFGKTERYSLPALMQATLDVEFVAQTMSQYTTSRASKLQGDIYVQLDQKTTKDASQQLQNELKEMRVVLKRLREGSRNEFLCFKKERGRAVSRLE